MLSSSQIVHNFSMSPPVDLRGLARELGIAVLWASNLPAGISGKITKVGDGKYSITINENDTLTRQRFTLAHEIAHYVLHRLKIGDGITDTSLFRGGETGSGLEAWVETQANRYAADILMPAELVRREWNAGKRTPGEFAHYFQVSPAAAEIRLSWLGLIP